MRAPKGNQVDGETDRGRHPSTDDPNELFDLVDLDDRVIGRVRRGEAHRNPALVHRSVQILVFARNGRLFLQRRSRTKDLFPGYYCASASGHVISGEEYLTTARREVEEELGVGPQLRFVNTALVRSDCETEITALFLARSDGPFTLSPTETDGGVWLALDDLRSGEFNLPLTPAARVAVAELDRLDRIKQLASYLDGL
jgi:isopentenyldiphosphate isomerase